MPICDNNKNIYNSTTNICDNYTNCTNNTFLNKTINKCE